MKHNLSIGTINRVFATELIFWQIFFSLSTSNYYSICECL